LRSAGKRVPQTSLVGILIDRIGHSASTLDDVVEELDIAECRTILVIGNVIHTRAGKEEHGLVRRSHVLWKKQIDSHTLAAIAGIEGHSFLTPIRGLADGSAIDSIQGGRGGGI